MGKSCSKRFTEILPKKLQPYRTEFDWETVDKYSSGFHPPDMTVGDKRRVKYVWLLLHDGRHSLQELSEMLYERLFDRFPMLMEVFVPAKEIAKHGWFVDDDLDFDYHKPTPAIESPVRLSTQIPTDHTPCGSATDCSDRLKSPCGSKQEQGGKEKNQNATRYKKYRIHHRSRKNLEDPVPLLELDTGAIATLKKAANESISKFGKKIMTSIDHFVSILDDEETFMDLAFQRSSMHKETIQGMHKHHFRLFFEVFEENILLKLIDHRIYRSKVRCSCIKFFEFLYYSLTYNLRLEEAAEDEGCFIRDRKYYNLLDKLKENTV